MRPAEGDFNPYYGRYIDLVEGDQFMEFLTEIHEDTRRLLENLSDEQAENRYAYGKWSVKEVVNHLCDCERVFSYRALRIARGDSTPLPGFEQDSYVDHSRAGDRPLQDLVDELTQIRKGTLLLFSNLNEDALKRAGTASDSPITVRALAFIIGGHEKHHQQILKERYLSS